MELVKKNVKKDQEIVYSKAVKAGKRIYYLDVKRNRRDELFLCITESKKIVSGVATENQHVQFEKHKIFLYKEDFAKFTDGLSEVIEFIKSENPGQFEQMRNNTEQEPLVENETIFELNLEELDA